MRHPSTFSLSKTLANSILTHLQMLYGDTAPDIFATLVEELGAFAAHHPEFLAAQRPQTLSEKDSILITYGDQIQAPGEATLQTLADVLGEYLTGIISSVHLLPFYPYSSDDGFSVTDYLAINPEMGTWENIHAIHKNFRLMFDAVINHISVKSDWFRAFLRGEPPYSDYFITVDPDTDLSSVTRPRTHPLLTPFETATGTKYVWTTFSADQADLNYKNPAVLLDILNVLLTYVSHGAEFIRLDAIGYLWKEIGTPCIHLPQTHHIIQLMRAVLDAVAPHVLLITETNVPHAENISYFGDGHNEAQLVYNFSLPPLVLHTLHTADATALSRWAASLSTPSNETSYFNFIASHDGIGVMPAKGILTDAEIDALVQKTLAHGGLVSKKTNPDGSQSPYELNITLFDALSDPHSSESQKIQVARFMVSQAIMLALAGVPGIYAHSLVGSHNNLIGVAETGRARTINREKWLRGELEGALANPSAVAAQVFRRYTQLLKHRAAHPAFHPHGGQEIISGNPAIFALWRTAPTDNERVLCLHNVSAQMQTFTTPKNGGMPLFDFLNDESFAGASIPLEPYQIRWLTIAQRA